MCYPYLIFRPFLKLKRAPATAVLPSGYSALILPLTTTQKLQIKVSGKRKSLNNAGNLQGYLAQYQWQRD